MRLGKPVSDAAATLSPLAPVTTITLSSPGTALTPLRSPLLQLPPSPPFAPLSRKLRERGEPPSPPCPLSRTSRERGLGVRGAYGRGGLGVRGQRPQRGWGEGACRRAAGNEGSAAGERRGQRRARGEGICEQGSTAVRGKQTRDRAGMPTLRNAPQGCGLCCTPARGAPLVGRDPLQPRHRHRREQRQPYIPAHPPPPRILRLQRPHFLYRNPAIL
ncbi:hypothetical protein HRbin28_00147 [bacterium HR28]|nr:hypothetical protein HRbin28_00147 [bacterium HR28]